MSVAKLPSTKRTVLATLVASLLGTAASAVAASDPPTGPAPAKTSTRAPEPQSQTIPLNSGIAPQEFSADARKVTMEVLPDGTRLYHMNGQGMQSLVAHLGADGKIEYTCTDKVETIVSDAATNVHEH